MKYYVEFKEFIGPFSKIKKTHLRPFGAAPSEKATKRKLKTATTKRGTRNPIVLQSL